MFQNLRDLYRGLHIHIVLWQEDMTIQELLEYMWFLPVFFYPWKSKYPWKRVFIFFLVFSGALSLKISRVVQSFHRFFYKFFQWLKLNFHDQKNLFSTGKITVFQWKVIFFGKGAWEYSVFAIKIRFKNTQRLNFSRQQTIFKVVMLLPITGRNYCSRGGSTSFSPIVSRFEEGKSKENFFTSIYVRSSLNLGGVSLIYYNTVSILHEQYHTKDTSEHCVYVPSNVSHPKSGSGKCVCVCVSHLPVSHL